mmetsp:Transcript_5346/g.15669  ORF Transcript_5346/g.15669 Transcript_5346/m.15669 type:complete len:221 (-) Transcript_5346:25-687(-)
MASLESTACSPNLFLALKMLKQRTSIRSVRLRRLHPFPRLLRRCLPREENFLPLPHLLLLFHRVALRVLSFSLPKTFRYLSSSPTTSRTLLPTSVSFVPTAGNSSSQYASFRSRSSSSSSRLWLVSPLLSLRLKTALSTSFPPPTLLSNYAMLPPPPLSPRVFPPSFALPPNNSLSNAPILSPPLLVRGPTLSKAKSYNSPLVLRVAFPSSLAQIDSPPL